jgi:predicted transcriptional regulator
MKREERDSARILRKEGKSLNDITLLGVSKTSVSTWVRNISLSDSQRKELTSRGFSVDAIEKRRENRINNTLQRHRIVMDAAKEKIDLISKRDLLLIGTALYWGEGGKANKGVACVANSDPKIIQIMMRFFREIYDVPETKFRGNVHTFSHLNAKTAEGYWSNISGIPMTQFYKTYSKPSIASLNKKDSLPYGTFQLYVCDTNIYLKIMGMIERLGEFTEASTIINDHLINL